MIGAYDEWGNVVDLVEWEKQIRADAISEAMHTFCEWLGHRYGDKTLGEVEEMLKEQKNE